MNRNEQCLLEWKRAATAAQEALERFKSQLCDAEAGYERDEEEIKSIWRGLREAGLEGWLADDPQCENLICVLEGGEIGPYGRGTGLGDYLAAGRALTDD